MKASEIMTVNVITVSEDATVEMLVKMLLDNHISGLPVVNIEGELIGMVTEGDLLRRTELNSEIKHRHWLEFFIKTNVLAKEYVQAHAQYVNEIMTTELISVIPSTPIGDIVSLMEMHNIKRVPVVDSGKLTGIISRSDVLKALHLLLENKNLYSTVDENLRQNILQEMNKMPWATDSIDIVIKSGEIHLVGRIFNEDIRSAIQVLIENFVSRDKIQDHLVFVEPVSGLFIPSKDESS